MNTVCFQKVNVPLDERVLIHVTVHRGGEKYRAVDGDSNGGERIVSDTVCEFTDDIRRCGDNCKQIGTVSKDRCAEASSLYLRQIDSAAQGFVR